MIERWSRSEGEAERAGWRGRQLVESYVLAPIVQRWSVNLSPALIIGGLTVLGSLFGIWGFILAAPLIAVLRVLLLRLWVGDALGDRAGAEAAMASGR